MKRLGEFALAFISLFVAISLILGFGYLLITACSWVTAATVENGPRFLNWFISLPGIIQVILAIAAISFCLSILFVSFSPPEPTEKPKRWTIDEVFSPGSPEPIEDVKHVAHSSSREP